MILKKLWSMVYTACTVLSITVGISIVAMVIDLWCHLTYNSRGAWDTDMPCSSQIIGVVMLHTMEKCYFLKPIIHSQIT